MKTLSRLIDLFEKDPRFLKEWRTDPVLAVRNRKIPEAGNRQITRIIDGLRKETHLKKQMKLFGM
ncbi:MAG: hypothetical protein HY541_04100 [Deltaproteobacteria bacterium]|nr:hypothetical protein [Deltaproteobacteria bacterium]